MEYKALIHTCDEVLSIIISCESEPQIMKKSRVNKLNSMFLLITVHSNTVITCKNKDIDKHFPVKKLLLTQNVKPQYFILNSK